MTCHEVHSRIEDAASSEAWWESGEVAEHAARCAACRGLVEQQRLLRDSIRLVRESAGPVPESLDAAVLAAYRRQWAEHCSAEYERRERLVTRIPRPAFGLRWGLAVAAVVLAVGLLLVPRKHNSTATLAPGPARPVATLEPQKIPTPLVEPAAKPKSSSARKHIRKPAPVTSASNATAAAAADFRSLMYCDELICTQEMDVIRVQLPVASIGRPVDFVPAGGMVNADVLIGPDGVARGIRIEQ